MTGEYAWTRLFGQASAVRKLLGGWDLEEAGESPQDFDLSLLAATLLNVVVTYRLTGCEVPSDVWKEAISEYPELSSEYRCYYTTWCQTGDKAVAFLGEEGWLGTTGDEAIRRLNDWKASFRLSSPCMASTRPVLLARRRSLFHSSNSLISYSTSVWQEFKVKRILKWQDPKKICKCSFLFASLPFGVGFFFILLSEPARVDAYGKQQFLQ
ncbi:MAG: hypothetical protein K0S20_531 [Patescibacteria group bacterium]|jgi:hypothetical protein|nr:hypothetical protein [Patescibacteria group bacterium]